MSRLIKRAASYFFPGTFPPYKFPDWELRERYNPFISHSNQETSKYEDIKGLFSQYHQEGISLVNKDTAAAKESFSKAMEHINTLTGQKEEVVARNCFELGKLYLNERNISQANENLKKAIYWASLSKVSAGSFMLRTYLYLGLAMIKKNKPKAAEVYLEKFYDSQDLCKDASDLEKGIACLEYGKIIINRLCSEGIFGTEFDKISLILIRSLSHFEKNKKDPQYRLCFAECNQVYADFIYKVHKNVQDEDHDLSIKGAIDYAKASVAGLENNSYDLERSKDIYRKLVRTISGLVLDLVDQRKSELATQFNEVLSQILNQIDRLDKDRVWFLASFLCGGLKIAAQNSETQKAKEIWEAIKKENFQLGHFENAEDYLNFINYTGEGLAGLDYYTESYEMRKKVDIKKIESKVDRHTLAFFYLQFAGEAFEVKEYKNALKLLEEVMKLAREDDNIGQVKRLTWLTGAYLAIKCCVKLKYFTKIRKFSDTLASETIKVYIPNSFYNLKTFYTYGSLANFMRKHNELSLWIDTLEDMLEHKKMKTVSEIGTDKIIAAFLIHAYLLKTDFRNAAGYCTYAENLAQVEINNRVRMVLIDSEDFGQEFLSHVFADHLEYILKNYEISDKDLTDFLKAFWSLIKYYYVNTEYADLLLKPLEECEIIIQKFIRNCPKSVILPIQVMRADIACKFADLDEMKKIVESLKEPHEDIYVSMIYVLYGRLLYALDNRKAAIKNIIKGINIYLEVKENKNNASNTFLNRSLMEKLISPFSEILPPPYSSMALFNYYSKDWKRRK